MSRTVQKGRKKDTSLPRSYSFVQLHAASTWVCTLGPTYHMACLLSVGGCGQFFSRAANQVGRLACHSLSNDSGHPRFTKKEKRKKKRQRRSCRLETAAHSHRLARMDTDADTDTDTDTDTGGWATLSLRRASSCEQRGSFETGLPREKLPPLCG